LACLRPDDNTDVMSFRIATPVALLIFNRPEETARVFEAIRRARPRVLFVSADGPRPDRPGEAERCAAARAITEEIDWQCQVFRNYSDTNLGCRIGEWTAFEWVFNTVEEAILLEDDCLPNLTFFQYCEELLERYRHDCRIMHISGNNFQFGRWHGSSSYYYSRYPNSWGWASWRRAWKHYDLHMTAWPELRRQGWLNDLFRDPAHVRFWDRIFQYTYEGDIDTWDYQWVFACWLQNGLSIIPNVNLISNIGHGPEATHTLVPTHLAQLATTAMSFPLEHPPRMMPDAKADVITQRTFYGEYTRFVQVKNMVAETLQKYDLWDTPPVRLIRRMV
jgi:hypothetical protein